MIKNEIFVKSYSITFTYSELDDSSELNHK